MRGLDYLDYPGPINDDRICNDEVKMVIEMPAAGHLALALPDTLA